MANPTPGPWGYYAKLSGSENHKGFNIHEENNPGRSFLAAVSPRDQDGIEGEANARLIAAAPDLLEAAIALREGLDILFARIIGAAPRDAAPETYHPSKSGKPWSALVQAKSAIAKATGKED